MPTETENSPSTVDLKHSSEAATLLKYMKQKKAKHHLSHPIDMGKVSALILGGGQGKRLFPLTLYECKPAATIGGRYKLIDIPVSNAINSGCSKIFIITQFLSSSLHRHIFRTYQPSIFQTGSVELLSVEQKNDKKSWFEGTADAVRKNLAYIEDSPAEYFLILSGDQLYTMDYREMVKVAKKTDADVVIAALPIESRDCYRMGVLQIDPKGMITSFIEKPQKPASLKQLQTSTKIKKKIPGVKETHTHLASMGIYLFKRDVLLKVLTEDPRHHFGSHLLPTLINEGNVAAYLFNGYWEDLGTIEAFYRANMALISQDPLLNFNSENHPIFTEQTFLPGAKISNTAVNKSIICEGSLIDADEVSHSILGPRSVVKKGSTIRESYLIGNECYRSHGSEKSPSRPFQIGNHSTLVKCIVDKNVTIGNNVELINRQNLSHFDSDTVFIRDGIIIVPRGAVIPDGYTL